MQPEVEKRPELKDLEDVLESGAHPGEFLEEVHAADLAQWIGELG